MSVVRTVCHKSLKMLISKTETEISLRRARHRWDDIKMDLKRTGVCGWYMN